MAIRKNLRNWLLRHPQINPYTVGNVGLLRLLSSNSRVFPNFLVIGAMKAGSTTLHQYINNHPNVIPASIKEVHYFDYYFGSDFWYRSNFPKKEEMLKNKITCLTGDSTPQYLFHPLAPKRVFDLLPTIKILCVLRNPIDRAFSHYNHNVRNGNESLSFEDAIFQRDNKLDQEYKNLISNNDCDVVFYERYNYLNLGKYAEQLSEWFKYFPKDQFFICKTEDLSSDTLIQAYEFLGLPYHDPGKIDSLNSGKYNVMNNKTREKLNKFYEPHNSKLSKLLKMKFNWK